MKEKKKKKQRGLRQKLIIIMFFMFLLVTIGMQVIVALIYVNWTKIHYAEKAMSNAKIVAGVVSPERIIKYRDTMEKDNYYEIMKNNLIEIRKYSEVKYIYVCIPEEKGYLYIWDAGDPDSDEGVMDLGDFDDYYGGGEEFMKRVFREAGEQKEDYQVTMDDVLVTSHPEYGSVASAFVPIFDSQGEAIALASVDVAMESIYTEVIILLFVTGFLMIIVMVVFCSIFYGQLENRLVRPIRSLNEVIQHFVSEQMKEGKVLENEIHTGDEIEELSRSFSAMSVELKDYMENFMRVTKEKERIGAELHVAQKIQEDMLPRIFPPYPERNDFSIYASMDPAKEVGGDFYDLFLVDENHIALVVADVSGKGIPAALFMVITKTLLKNRTMMGGAPIQIISDVNDQLCEGNEAEFFVTIWFAIIDLTTGDGVAVNAGHEHPILRRKDGDYELVKYKHAPPVGAMSGLPFGQRTFHLDPGDVLFVYTDGLAEATNAQDELYGTERILDALNRNKDAEMADLIKAVQADVDTFVGDAPQFDDLTMLAFRLNE